MSAITSTTSSTNSTSTASAPASGQTLNQADFLKLLVTQMSSQDPLNPMSDTDFAAQLAQFSALQETTSVAGGVQALQASSLIGMTVGLPAPDSTSSPISGVVSGVDMSSGAPQVLVNGQEYSLSQITSVLPTQSQTSN